RPTRHAGKHLIDTTTPAGDRLVTPAAQTAICMFNLTPRPQTSTLFPYTTLFRSDSALTGDQTALFNNYGTFVKSVGDPTFLTRGPHEYKDFNHSSGNFISLLISGTVEVQQGELLLGWYTQVTISGTVVGDPGTQV